MSTPATIQLVGSVQGAPAQPTLVTPSLQEILNVGTSFTYGSSKSGRPTINAPAVPFVLNFETITKGRFFALRVRGGTLQVALSNPTNADQIVRVSDLLIVSCPNPGDELTGITMLGVADIEYLLAGDVT